MTDDALFAAVLIALVGFAAFINGTIGLGFALLAVNVLAIALGAKDGVIVMSLLTPFVSSLQALYHRAFRPRWRRMSWLVVGALIGSVVGAQLLVLLPTALVSLALGAFTIWFVIGELRGSRAPLATATERRLAPLAGFVGGVSNSALGASGPVFGTYLTAIGLRGREFAFAISVMFFSMSLIRLGLLAGLGQYTAELVAVAALLLVPSVVMQWVGLWFRGRVPAATIQTLVLIALAAAGTVLLWRGLEAVVGPRG